MKRMVAALLLMPFLMILLGAPVFADEEGSDSAIDYDYSQLIDELPDDVKALLPDGLEEADESSIAEAFNGDYWATLCSDLLRKGLTAGLKLFASLLGLILVCGVLARCSELFVKKQTQLFDYAILLIAALELYGSIYSLFDLARQYIGQVNDYMTAISAAMGGIYLLSANISLAAVQSVWFGILLSVSEKITHGLLFPLLQMSFAMTLVSSICPDVNLRSISSFIRQICTTLLIASMTLISILMSFQTSIASAADSMGLRSVKFAASNAIPLIGGMVSESLKTLSTSLSLVKSTAGLIGVVGILLCTLVPLSVLFTCRYALSLSSTAADLIEASTIKPLIEEAGKLVGFLIAVLLIFSIFYIFTLSLLIHTANALA